MPTNKIRQLPEGFEWKIEWEHDPDGDQDMLGEWSRESYFKSYRVNIKEGWLLGPDEKGSYEQRVWAGDEYPEQIIDSDGRVLDLQDEDTGEYYYDGVRILRSGLSEYHGDHADRRYWYPPEIRFGKDESIAKLIQEYGLEKVLDDIVADYELHISWCNNDWHYEWCSVKLKHEDFEDEIRSDSMGGIADANSSYCREVEEDLMWQALDLETIEEFLKGLDESYGDYQENIAEFRTWYQEVTAEREAYYDAQRAEWEAKWEAKKKNENLDV